MARKAKVKEPEYVYVPQLDIYDRLNAGEFENKLTYERHSKNPEAYDAYQAETSRLMMEFKKACEEDQGVVGNPKADMLWSKAWERGHSSGYHEVYGVYNDLVELIK